MTKPTTTITYTSSSIDKLCQSIENSHTQESIYVSQAIKILQNEIKTMKNITRTYAILTTILAGVIVIYTLLHTAGVTVQ